MANNFFRWRRCALSFHRQRRYYYHHDGRCCLTRNNALVPVFQTKGYSHQNVLVVAGVSMLMTTVLANAEQRRQPEKDERTIKEDFERNYYTVSSSSPARAIRCYCEEMSSSNDNERRQNMSSSPSEQPNEQENDERSSQKKGGKKDASEEEEEMATIFGFRRRRLSSLLSETLLGTADDDDTPSSDENGHSTEGKESENTAESKKEAHEQEHERLGHVIRRQSTRASPATTSYGFTKSSSSNGREQEHGTSLQKRITAAAALSKAATMDRDTFLYAKEIENLNQENPLQTVHNSNNNKNEQTLERSLSSSKRTPFPPHIVGTFSCHGIEPLPIRRLLTPIELQFFLLTASITSKSLVHAKINQDRGVVAHPYGNDPNMALFGVFDGHGLHGDDVAHYAMKETLRRLKHHPRFPTKQHATSNKPTTKSALTQDFHSSSYSKKNNHYDDLAHAFCDTFHQMDQDLHRQRQGRTTTEGSATIDDLFSGTTACVILVDGTTRTLYVANIGDSRAVLAIPSKPSTNSLQRKEQQDEEMSRDDRSSSSTTSLNHHRRLRRHYAIDLTQDQYPNLPGEKQRLEAYGGYISDSDGPCGRVWNRPPQQFYQTKDDKTEYDGGRHEPMYGLAMSRSIGDHFLERVGVISTPVVTAHEIPPPSLPRKSNALSKRSPSNTSSSSSGDDNQSSCEEKEQGEDVFLILASDGVWSVLKSDEAVDIVSEALEQNNQNASVACEILIETAMEQWRAVEGEYRDDITAVVVRLNRLFS